MNPTVSVIVPTFNRAALWKKRYLLDSLRAQTDPDFEVLVADDSSTDDTLDVLRMMLPLAFKRVRLFQTTVPKENASQASALPDNVMFANARGQILIHLDDDGMVDRHLVEFVKKLVPPRGNAVYYGPIEFVDPVTLKPYDGPLGADKRIEKYSIARDAMTRLKRGWMAEYGALWVTWTDLVRRAGGHEMENVAWRGCDSRLGVRLRDMAATYIVTKPQMVFRHIGPSWQQQKIASGELADIKDQQRIPQFLSYRPDSSVVNGGLQFWASGVLEKCYLEIKL